MPLSTIGILCAYVLAGILLAIPLTLRLVIYPKMPAYKRDNPGAWGALSVLILGVVMLVLVWDQPWVSPQEQSSAMFPATLLVFLSLIGTMPSQGKQRRR